MRNMWLMTAIAIVGGSVAAPAVGATATPEAVGSGGAVASIDADATAAGLQVLHDGGNAIDAVVATAAAVGVTDPFSSGIGGGGFLLYYEAATGTTHFLDGRETAPAAATPDMFTANGVPLPFDTVATGGLGVGVPGTPSLWARALSDFGTIGFSDALAAAEKLARLGFEVDETFAHQISQNADRFARFPDTAALYLPDGAPPAVGTTFDNVDLAATLRELRQDGPSALYSGGIGEDLVAAVQQPPTEEPVQGGSLTTADLAAYHVVPREPVRFEYAGHSVASAPPPSSAGTTIGEILGIVSALPAAASDTDFHHNLLEASRFAFADRDRWIGDPTYVNVPVQDLLAPEFAQARACLIGTAAQQGPVAAGSIPPSPCASAETPTVANEGDDTTHITVVDGWGNIAVHTLTIQQEGGAGYVVPGRGFLLNNELTDFTFAATHPDEPNLPAPGKRPRSSMAPTLVFEGDRPVLALGSPGGATIITTISTILADHLGRGTDLAAAIAAPRASQRNGIWTQAEPGFNTGELAARGHHFHEVSEIGAVTAVAISDIQLRALAEPARRGGGTAAVCEPATSTTSQMFKIAGQQS